MSLHASFEKHAAKHVYDAPLQFGNKDDFFVPKFWKNSGRIVMELKLQQTSKNQIRRRRKKGYNLTYSFSKSFETIFNKRKNFIHDMQFQKWGKNQSLKSIRDYKKYFFNWPKAYLLLFKGKKFNNLSSSNNFYLTFQFHQIVPQT